MAQQRFRQRIRIRNVLECLRGKHRIEHNWAVSVSYIDEYYSSNSSLANNFSAIWIHTNFAYLFYTQLTAAALSVVILNISEEFYVYSLFTSL